MSIRKLLMSLATCGHLPARGDSIWPLDKTRDEEIARRHIALLKKAPRVGKLLYKKREDIYDR